MLFANLFYLLVAQHSACLGNLILVLIRAVCLFLRVFTSITVLLDFKSRPSGSVLSKILRCTVTVGQSLGRAFVRLRLLVLISISQRLLPLLSVLSSSETTNASDLANLVIDFVDIDVSFKLLHGADEGHFTHHHDLLKKEVDQAVFERAIVVLHLGLYQRGRLDCVDWVIFSSILGGNSIFF